MFLSLTAAVVIPLLSLLLQLCSVSPYPGNDIPTKSTTTTSHFYWVFHLVVKRVNVKHVFFELRVYFLPVNLAKCAISKLAKAQAKHFVVILSF